MNHRNKQRLARKMFDNDPEMWEKDKDGKRRKKSGYGMFGSHAWEERRRGIRTRVLRKEAVAKKAAEERRQKRGQQV